MATYDTERLAPDPRQPPLAYDEPTLRAHIDQALQAEPPEIQAQRQTLIAQMQQDLFDWRRDPQTVDMTRWTDVNPTRELIRNMGEAAQERAYFIKRDGITLAPGTAQEIGTGGTDQDYLATKVHPVWADELRYETQHLREMGEIGTLARDQRPWETDYEAWPPAQGESGGHLGITQRETDQAIRRIERREQESSEARQAREYDEWEMSDAGIAAQDAEIAAFERRHTETSLKGLDARPAQELDRMSAHEIDRWVAREQEQAQAPREALSPEQRRALRHSLHGLHRLHGQERHPRAQEGSGYGF